MSLTFAQTIIPLAASLVIAIMAYFGLKDIKIISLGGKSADARLGEYAEQDKRNLTDKLGDTLLDKFGLNTDSWGMNLRWAQLGGYYTSSSVGSFLGQSILYGGVTFAAMFMIGGLNFFTIAMPVVAAWMPFLQLRDKAELVRETIRRSLPEAAAFMAGEMAAGISADAALTRIGILTGPLAAVIETASDQARTSQRLLLSQASVKGYFREFTEALKMQDLISFASQVDMVAERGAEGPKLMGDVARMLARNYRTEVNRAAAGLGMKILMPMSIFFLVPMLAAMLVPLFISAFNTFA